MKIVRFSADFRFFILAETQISGFYFINSEKNTRKKIVKCTILPKTNNLLVVRYCPELPLDSVSSE